MAAKMGKYRLFTLFVWMLVDSGARKSEVPHRTWQELDISSGKVIVPRTKNVDSRTLFFTPETMALAKRLKPTLATWPYRDRAVLVFRPAQYKRRRLLRGSCFLAPLASPCNRHLHGRTDCAVAGRPKPTAGCAGLSRKPGPSAVERVTRPGRDGRMVGQSSHSVGARVGTNPSPPAFRLCLRACLAGALRPPQRPRS